MESNSSQKPLTELLMHESAQLHDNIQRCLDDMNKLSALAFPIVTGVFLLAIEDKLSEVKDPGTLFSLFAVLSSVIAIIFNNVWMQLLGFTRYKYVEVLPRLYRIAGRDGENFGQYVARGGLVRAMTGSIVIQAVLLPVAAASCYKVWADYHQNTYAVGAYFAIALAAATTIISWRVAYETVGTAAASARPE